jgi:hypothetical protein
MSETTQPATEPRFPMPAAAVKKAEREGRSVAAMPIKDFEKPSRPPALSPGRIQHAESAYRTHAALVEANTSREAILESSFWVHVANKLRPLDTIRVMDDLGTWVVELIVRAVGAKEAIVAVLWSADLAKAPAIDMPAEFKATYRGLKHKWSAVRAADNEVVRDGFGTREEAEVYIRSHVKALAA